MLIATSIEEIMGIRVNEVRKIKRVLLLRFALLVRPNEFDRVFELILRANKPFEIRQAGQVCFVKSNQWEMA